MAGDAIDVVELYRDVSSYNSQFNHNTSDQMKLVGLGELPPPAQCFICGSGTCDAGYVNFGIWAEFIGNLFICSTCLTQASELVGCLAPSVKDLLSRNMTALQDHSKKLEAELNDTRSKLDASNYLLHSHLTAASAGVVVNETSVEESLRDSGEVDAAVSGEGLANSDTNESTVSEGSVPVSESPAFDPTASGLSKI